MFDLTGRVALVTGAGQNVGTGIARALARQGSAVAINDFHPDRARRIADEINGAGGHAVAIPFDVTDFAAVTAGFAEASGQLGPIDVLVNNAGTGGPLAPLQMMQFVDMPPEAWSPIIDVNLFGPLNCSKAVIASMIERRFGRIVTISSGAGETGMDIGVSAYAAGKAGAAGFMRHLAVENAKYGITVNTVALGLVLEDASLVEGLAKTIPVGRIGRPDDVGALAVFLASDEAAWLTGQTIGLNGGQLTS